MAINKYTEDWIPIKGITNGAIVTKNNELVTGVKILPKNIFILDSLEQDNMMIALKNFYNIIDFEFWLVVADKPVDLSVYLSQLQLLYNDESHPAIRKLIYEDIEKASYFKERNVVDTEYFFLFKEKNPEMLQKKVRLLINGLAGCGLNASQTSNGDLRTILDNLLNGGMKTEFGTVVSE